MTNPFYGSSLFQARKTKNVHRHSHSHLHNRKPELIHARSHADFHNRRQETADLDPRGSAITEVVQTISVVQIIDGTGATLSAQTVVGSSQTDLIDSETGATLAVNDKAVVTTSSDVESTTTSAVTAVSSVDPVSATDTSSITPTETDSDSATSTPAALSLTHISASLPASSFSTLSSTSNSTISSLTSSLTSSSLLSSLSTSSSPSNSSSTSSTDSASFTPSPSFLSGSLTSDGSSTTFASSTTSTPVSSLSSPFSSSTTWPWDSSSTGWLSPSDSASATSILGGAGGSGATPTTSGTSSTSAASGSSSDSASTQTSKMAGGIVGGIAGVALLVGLAFMVLRLKKRGWCHLRLGSGDDEPDAAARKALPAPRAGGGGGGPVARASGAYGTMQQRSAPQAVAASLAALAGKRSSRERAGSGAEMAERGFVRVSGKKLPPVLQYGGDGYSDPRDNRASHMSDASASVYRDSMAVFDQPNHQRLALGSPMRPESGIMTMHPGPARTPVTSQVPKAIETPSLPRSSTFPSADPLGRTLESEDFSRDAIGRTLAAHDQSRDGTGSRGSHNSRGSTRFTEHVT